MTRPTIDEIWYAPALLRSDRKPLLLERYMRPTRKHMIQDFIDGTYAGAHDWAYRRKLGWRSVRLRVTGSLR